MRAKCVDADIGIAWMDEDLLVLLVPGIERVPVEPRGSGHPLDRIVTKNASSAGMYYWG
jgi:hypothetical protein